MWHKSIEERPPRNRTVIVLLVNRESPLDSVVDTGRFDGERWMFYRYWNKLEETYWHYLPELPIEILKGKE